MSTVLTTFGIGDDSDRLYRRVLRQDGLRLEQHAEALDWPFERARSALLPLVELRLIRQDLDASLVAPHPRAALTRLVDRENARLNLRRRYGGRVPCPPGIVHGRAVAVVFVARTVAGGARLIDQSIGGLQRRLELFCLLLCLGKLGPALRDYVFVRLGIEAE